MNREKIKLVHCHWMVPAPQAWYCVEFAEHDGIDMTVLDDARETQADFNSALICNKAIEGPADDMVGLAQAILSKERYNRKRCAVMHDPIDDVFLFWNPHNESTRAAVQSFYAEEFAREALKELEGEQS